MDKKVGRPCTGNEPKKSYNVYLEPTAKEAIIANDGSLTKALELRHKQIKRKNNK